MSMIRIAAGGALLIGLAACGGGDDTVRSGPQAVHPSPSFLANGVFLPVEGQSASVAQAPCGHHGHHCQHGHGHHHHAKSYSKYDGSTPIID